MVGQGMHANLSHASDIALLENILNPFCFTDLDGRDEVGLSCDLDVVEGSKDLSQILRWCDKHLRSAKRKFYQTVMRF
jgi:hypothetical protein